MTLNPAEPTIARIENAVIFMAYVVENFGERYAPVLDSLLADLEAAKQRESPRERARRILDEAEANGAAVPRRPRKDQ